MDHSYRFYIIRDLSLCGFQMGDDWGELALAIRPGCLPVECLTGGLLIMGNR